MTPDPLTATREHHGLGGTRNALERAQRFVEGDTTDIAQLRADVQRLLAIAEAARAFCADCGPCNGGVTPDAAYIGPPEDKADRCWLCGDLREALADLDQPGDHA